MNFKPELAEAVMEGRKWVTRRAMSDNPRSPYHSERARKLVGKRIAVCPGRGKNRIGSVVVAHVSGEEFWPGDITPDVARSEGFGSVDAFKHTWLTINGNLDPINVWRIELDRKTVSRSAPQSEGRAKRGIPVEVIGTEAHNKDRGVGV